MHLISSWLLFILEVGEVSSEQSDLEICFKTELLRVLAEDAFENHIYIFKVKVGRFSIK